MRYATHLMLFLTSLTTLDKQVHRELDALLESFHDQLHRDLLNFVGQEVNPSATHAFESQLAKRTRELARQVIQRVCNLLEADDPQQLPHDVTFEAGGYRRINNKTPNRHVATLFGTITLWRYPYRYWHREGSECIFPLEIQLGLVHGATPALAEAAARYMADSGATQRAVLARLKSQHDVAWGPPRLRDVTRDVAESMASVQQEYQVLRVLELLHQAHDSKGRCKPVLSVGRDGVTLREYHDRLFEHATAATVSVYDRRGKRLGTVYLAYVPESLQREMTRQLTALLREILRCWEGPLPRLCYVTDAGSNETTYYRKVLRCMLHPRTGEPLGWYRIIDFYHTSERIWTMAEALFGKGKKQKVWGQAWARRMLKLLKKPGGPSRVLHSAAALHSGRTLPNEREKAYRKAYNYLRCRTRFMQYAEYARLHLPLGSGVTEAACKTIYAQRMKLSGQRWESSGAQPILHLRAILLSGIWDQVYQGVLKAESQPKTQPRTYTSKSSPPLRTAA